MTPEERKYTAERFLGMLEHKRPTCVCCPFQRDFRAWQANFVNCYSIESLCRLCHEAVGLEEDGPCPCKALGEQNAIKAAWLFVEDSRILEAPHA